MRIMQHIHDMQQLVGEITSRSLGATRNFVIAIEGRSGAGKSTLAGELADLLGAALISQDDFYSGGTLSDWANLTSAQKADRVIDWRRVRREAIEPLIANQRAEWHPFDWETLKGLAPQTISAEPRRLIILDGVYSARPELSDLINLSVLVHLDDNVRRARLRKREGADFVSEWHPVWDEAEDYYFLEVRPPAPFDLIFERARP
jgi:uridine kinase